MTVWEKALVNMEKGYAKLSSFANNFSERVKSDITIIRARMQMDEVRKQIAREHAVIGNRLLEQSENGTLPSSFEHFFAQDEIVSARDAILKLEKEISGLEEELAREAHTIAAPVRKDEGKAL